MPYTIGNRIFSTKAKIRQYCQLIRDSTPDGQQVEEEHLGFLFELFSFHDEWGVKSNSGVLSISTTTTAHGSRCFILNRQDGQTIDISYEYALRCLPTSRTVNNLPQKLIDFRNGARTAISDQIKEFRDNALLTTPVCEISGIELNQGNSAVDHISPNTFDSILFDFCNENEINPMNTDVTSEYGVVAVITDNEVRNNWQEWHREHAKLRLISKTANLQLKKLKIDWIAVCG